MANEVKYLGENSWQWISFFIYTELLKYQKAVEGKGLSTNDFTTELKSKLEGIDLTKYQLAENGKGLSTNDFTTALKNKLDGIDLTKYSTTGEMTKAINDAIAGVTGISFVKPEGGVLPETGQTGYIYLIPNGEAGDNVYDEYFWDKTANKFEKFGSTAVDLTDYLKKEDVTELTKAEVYAIWQRFFPDATMPE